MFEADRDLPAIDLTPEETRELLALEVNCAQLVPEKDEELLESIMQEYRLTREEMAPFLQKSQLSRNDIWELQLLKRRSQQNYRAVQVLVKLRGLETRIGAELLRTFVDRSKLLAT